MNKALADMARIGQMVLDGDLAELRAVSDRIDALRARVAELDAQLAARARVAQAPDAQDLALIHGRDEAWADWIALQKAELRRQLAALRPIARTSLPRRNRALGGPRPSTHCKTAPGRRG